MPFARAGFVLVRPRGSDCVAASLMERLHPALDALRMHVETADPGRRLWKPHRAEQPDQPAALRAMTGTRTVGRVLLLRMSRSICRTTEAEK